MSNATQVPGSIDTMSISSARTEQASSQSRLSSFGDDDGGESTYIGVVSSSSDEVEEVVDENDTRLAPPDELFYQWLNTKRNLEDKFGSGVGAHNAAFDTVNYEPRFVQYIRTNGRASKAIQSLVSRLYRGEDIILVCYCTGERKCHSELIVEEVRSQI